MPIDITPLPTTAVQTTETTITANAIWIDALTIDGSKRDTANPSASATITPYLIGSPNVYAGTSWPLKTKDIYAAAANIPEFGAALMSVETAMGAWHNYNLARQTDLDAANAAVTKAISDVSAAQSAVDESAQSRNAAFAARSSETDPAWISADNAWTQAVATLATAQSALTTANANVATATAALADPANPRLVI